MRIRYSSIPRSAVSAGLVLWLSGCSWFSPGSWNDPFWAGGSDYYQRDCVNSFGQRVPCERQAHDDRRRCTNARGTAIYCRPGDAQRPEFSGSAPPRYPYPDYANRAPQPPERYDSPYGSGPYANDYGRANAQPYGQPYEQPDRRPVFGPPTIPPPSWRAPSFADVAERGNDIGAGGAAAAPRQPAASGRGGFILGVGDVISITVFGQPDMSTRAVVSDGGRVTIPLVGPVNIAGLTPLQAEQRIAGELVRGDFLLNPQVNVNIEEYRSRQISVMGQVQQPGRITMERDMTLVDAIAQASGTTPEAADHALLIREGVNGPEQYPIDLRNSLAGRDRSALTTLQDGDTIYVPEVSTFYIYGQVRNPAQLPLEPGLTVLQALSLGGGLTELASVNKVTIRRRAPDGLLRSFQAKLDDLVKPGDVIFVDEGLF